MEKLTKAKYQDNLEFLQWLKRYHDLNYNGEPYDAVGRRKGQDLHYIGGASKPSSQLQKAMLNKAPAGTAGTKITAKSSVGTGKPSAVGAGA